MKVEDCHLESLQGDGLLMKALGPWDGFRDGVLGAGAFLFFSYLEITAVVMTSRVCGYQGGGLLALLLNALVDGELAVASPR